ncbi:polyprenyl synthetase family protein [Streptomyces sp. NPDC090077]|uniref:polyprenyl synthetase family protein n=1 Tax=Streptomyces sp. NPDC090077 TaxID=3365938 RepID=UPI003827E484
MAATASARHSLAAVRAAVDAHLDDYFAGKARAAADDGMPPEVIDVLRGFVLGGGKRLRPLLCACGWYAAGGTGDTGEVVTVGAALEMFHAFALVHDDVMDRSATRRGRATVHETYAGRFRHGRTPGAAERLGTGAAILTGDLALAWSDEILHSAGLDGSRLTALLAVTDAMRTELMYGQYLDLCATGRFGSELGSAFRILRYKTAKYTFERPLHIGAILAGGDAHVLQRLTAYALPLGEAFQLRDDLLGVFGTPGTTGKPCLDDLRDGKHSVLVALALRHCDPAQREALHRLVGHPALDESGAGEIRAILVATGARARVERMIRARRSRARRALADSGLPAPAADALHRIARAATVRSS